MKMKKIAAGCCSAALAMLIMTNSGICSEAMFGQSITDTEDIEIYIDVGAERQEISKYIYGLNLSPDMDGVTVYGTKQRGEAISSYNWETNSANMTAAEDYENSYALVSEYSQKDWSVPALYTSDLVKKAAAHNIGSRYVTLQMMGFVANDSYGAAEFGDADRWAAVRFNKGNDLSIQPDLHDGAVYMDEYVSYLVSTYGYAADGGINGYFLDREPEMWDENFAIVRSSPITAEELAVSSATLAASVKKIDPTALVYGPSVNGIESYVNLCNQKDWDNHSREYSWFIDFYLDRMHAASEAAGTRLLDVLDLHFISDAKSVVLEPIIGSSSTFANEERVQAVRALWDGNYTENSSNAILYKQHTPIIPMVQASIRMYYPGTKLSFSEYNFGGGDHISGGIAQADVLGVFGEQDVYMACLLPDKENFEYQKAGINLYTNYDGNGASYGNIAVYADNGGDTMSSVYASVEELDDSALRVILINKNEATEKSAAVSIASDVDYSGARVFYFDEESSEIRCAEDEITVTDNKFEFTMVPQTVYLLEFEGAREEPEVSDITGNDIGEPQETSVTVATEPEHVDASVPTTTPASAGEQVITETVTSISIVGTDKGGEIITEIVPETVTVTLTPDETTPADDPHEGEKTVPKAVKAIVSVLVGLVAAAMVIILITDFRVKKK